MRVTSIPSVVLLAILTCPFFCVHRCRQGIACRAGPANLPGEDAPVSVMGCGTSKVLPEPPKDVQLDLVKKVEPSSGTEKDVHKHFITEVNSDLKAGFPAASQCETPAPVPPLPATQNLLQNHHAGPGWLSTGLSLTHV